MSKVYQYSKKIFKIMGAFALLIGVGSCTTTQTAAAVSGETDGVYYSPDRDGRVDYANNATAGNDYDIRVGGAYFDANGDGAEEFYYDEDQNRDGQQSGSGTVQNINIYNSGSTGFSTSPSADWGRYDGLDITINYGWYDPWWRFGYSSFWGWNWNYPYFGSYWGWGYPYYGFYGYSPFWGWGYPYHGYNPYWGWGYPYYGYGYGYGYYYGGYPYYYRGSAVVPGLRPGSGLSYGNGTPFRTSSSFRDTRTGNGLSSGNVRAVRGTRGEAPVRSVRGETSGVRNGSIHSGIRTQNSGVRTSGSSQNGIRTGNSGVRDQNSSGNVSTGVKNPVRSNSVQTPVRQVRPSAPEHVRPNSNVSQPRNNSNIRNNNSNMSTPRNSSPRIRSGNISTPRRSSSSSGINRMSAPRNSSPSVRSAPSMGGSRMGGGVRSGGSVRR